MKNFLEKINPFIQLLGAWVAGIGLGNILYTPGPHFLLYLAILFAFTGNVISLINKN